MLQEMGRQEQESTTAQGTTLKWQPRPVDINMSQNVSYSLVENPALP
jgi:hypothetical protein